jgi:hypothetical protein
MRKRSWMALFIFCLLLVAAYSQEKRDLSDDQVVRERLSFVENALLSAQPRAKSWWYGWISGYSAGAVVMGSLAATHWNDTKLDPLTQQQVRDRDFAQDMLVGGATFAFGVAGLLIDPFVPAFGPSRLREMPEGTSEERRLKLQEAEKLLRECASRENKGRSWTTHLLNLGVNCVAGLVTVLAFDRPWSDGLLTFASGEAISLLNIFTQPRRAIIDLNNYEVRYLGKPGTFLVPPENRHFSLGLYPGGFSLRMSF